MIVDVLGSDCVLPVDDIDTKETAKNVDAFLRNDFIKYARLCGLTRADLQSPTITGMPSGSNFGNSAENKMMRIFEAEDIVKSVKETICKKCSAKSSKILSLCYLSNMLNWQVARRLDYSTSRFAELKRCALCEFADFFDYYRYRYDLKVSDLHVYK